MAPLAAQNVLGTGEAHVYSNQTMFICAKSRGLQVQLGRALKFFSTYEVKYPM